MLKIAKMILPEICENRFYSTALGSVGIVTTLEIWPEKRIVDSIN